MKHLFLFSLLLISFNSFCQKEKKAIITFNTSKVKASRNNLFIEIQKYQRDSGNYVLLKNIKVVKPIFSITMQADEPIECILSLKSKDSFLSGTNPFYISNEPISIVFDKSKVFVKSRQSDFFQKNYLVYLDMPSAVRNEYGFKFSLLKKAYELPDTPSILVFKIKEYENNVIDLVSANKSFYRTLTALHNIRSELTPKTLETCFKILKPYWKNTTVFKQLEEYIIQEKKIFIGKQLPVFTLLSKELSEWQSTGFYNQHDFTFIDFWASWCVPCRAQIKTIQAMYSDIDTSRMHIVSVSIDEDKRQWMDAVKQDSTVWSNYIDTKGGWNGNVAKNFNLTYIPSNVIVDKTGKIVALNVSVEGLKDFMFEHGVIKKSE
jgi:thiol-disulfide isomerase/thioredoxin